MLNLGRFAADKGRILTPGRDEGVWKEFPVASYLIEADNGQRILVDTGMHRKHIHDPDATFRGRALARHIRPIMRVADDIAHRLGEIGLTANDIDIVVSTHFHFDHAGNHGDFGGARVIAQREAFAFARANPVVFPPGLWDLPHLSYDLIDGDIELAPGVSLLATSGHVPGHMSVVVRLPRTGTIVLAIDAITLRESLERDHWAGHMEPDRARASGHRLAEIARRERGVLIPGHDSGVWSTLKRSPDFYD